MNSSTRTALTLLHRRGLRAAAGDGGAALLIALFTMLLAGVLSLAVLATVIGQVAPTQFGQKNVRTVHAAEAGIDVALGELRNASTTDPADPATVIGDRSQLPCDSGGVGVLAGDVAGSPGELEYRTEVRYFSQDPAGQDEAWRDANMLACATLGGPVLTPNFALITSEGLGADLPRSGADAGERQIETIYKFSLTNENVSGGLIARFNDGNSASLNLCFDAGSETPNVGDPLLVKVCAPGNPAQLWSWGGDSTIALSVTQNTTSGSPGLCVAGLGASSTVTSVPLTLQVCDTGAYTQKWGFTDNAAFAARLRNTNPSSNTPQYCIYLPNDNTAGSTVRAGTGNPGCSSGSGNYNRIRTWRPDARVGAGKAGYITGNVSGQQFQWVNFFEFGRCFDVTNWDPNYTFMIAFPCKQDVSGYVGWNQTLEWNDVSGHLFTYSGNTGWTFPFSRDAPQNRPQRCLTAPVTNGGRVLLQPCSVSEPRHSWEVYRERATYADSYTIEDSNGRCLSIGLPGTTTGDLAQWSTIVTETCNGSARQKWNAPPDAAPTALRDTQELPQ